MIAEAGHYALVLALGLALIRPWYRLPAPACTIRP
jgi:hypothetical protein